MNKYRNIEYRNNIETKKKYNIKIKYYKLKKILEKQNLKKSEEIYILKKNININVNLRKHYKIYMWKKFDIMEFKKTVTYKKRI